MEDWRATPVKPTSPSLYHLFYGVYTSDAAHVARSIPALAIPKFWVAQIKNLQPIKSQQK